MGYFVPKTAPAKSDLTAKNRVWGFFGESVSVCLETRPTAPEAPRKNYDDRRKPASGIPFWPSRDPIGERGGVNLYGFVYNNPMGWFDVLGGSPGNSGWRPGPRSRNSPAPGSSGNPINFPRLIMGIPFSVLSGDVFSRGNPIPSYDDDQCEFLITVGGINMTRQAQEAFRDGVAALPGFQGIENAVYVNNPTRWDIRPGGREFGLGDWGQIVGDEFGAIGIAAWRLASQILAAAQKAEDNKCCCWYIHIVAHSQGTMVTRTALNLVDQEVRERITFTGLGGQTTIGSDQGINHAVNLAEQNDPVSGMANSLSFWNPGPPATVFDNTDVPHGVPSHDWDNVYLRYLNANESALNEIPRCATPVTK